MPNLIPQPRWVPDCHEDGETTRVVYADTEVRAEGTLVLPNTWLVLDHNAPDEVTIEWEATAKEANKRLRGTVAIPVSPVFIGVDDLLEKPPSEN